MDVRGADDQIREMSVEKLVIFQMFDKLMCTVEEVVAIHTWCVGVGENGAVNDLIDMWQKA